MGGHLRDQHSVQPAPNQFAAGAKLKAGYQRGWNEMAGVSRWPEQYRRRWPRSTASRSGQEIPANHYLRASFSINCMTYKPALERYGSFWPRARQNPDEEFKARQMIAPSSRGY